MEGGAAPVAAGPAGSSAATPAPTPPPTPPRPAGPPPARPLTGRQKAAFLAMVVGMFMAILDIQIVSSSLSEIQAGLSASATEVSWVQTSYLIAEVVMIPLSGYLSRLLSTRVLFVGSVAGFTVMSLACAMANSLGAMVLFRLLQGFLGGAMIPTAFAASFMLFPPQRRAAVGVMMGLVATMAPTIGPTLGGYLTQLFSWHWLFLINLPPGLVVGFAVWALLDIDKPDRSLLRGFDVAGLVLMAVFLGSTEYVLEEGPRWQWLEDPSVAVMAVVATVGGLLFFARVLTYRRPIVDLTAFADRNFALGCLFSFVLGVGLYGSVYLLPLFLAQVRGYNSLQIGQIMMVTGACQFASAPLAGILSKRIDLRLMLAIGLGLFGTGVYLNHFVTSEWGFWELMVPQGIRGLSLMLCFLPINTLALGTLSHDKLKNASGLYNLMRNLGGALGLAVINTVLIERQALHLERLSEHLTLTSPKVQAMLDGLTVRLGGAIVDSPSLPAIEMLSRMTHRQALVLTFADCLLLMAGVFYCAMLMMPLIRKPRLAGGGH
ncbi:MAG: DHA2 family efflux MFS transporter permease subunit [Dongiaceae bacterium]